MMNARDSEQQALPSLLVEVLTPRQSTLNIESDLETFQSRYRQILACGGVVSVPDNPLGHPHFTVTEVLSHLDLVPQPDQILVHVNTFHRRSDLDAGLDQLAGMGVRRLLVVSGDGGPRLPKLEPSDFGMAGPVVTSVELLRYIGRRHGDRFTCGVAFNPYEPPEHEADKMRRKIEAGARFIVTQPVMENHAAVQALSGYRMPVWIGAWMSKRIEIFQQCIGREPVGGSPVFEPWIVLRRIRTFYPSFGLYLSMVNFKQDWCAMLRESNPAASVHGEGAGAPVSSPEPGM